MLIWLATGEQTQPDGNYLLMHTDELYPKLDLEPDRSHDLDPAAPPPFTCILPAWTVAHGLFFLWFGSARILVHITL